MDDLISRQYAIEQLNAIASELHRRKRLDEEFVASWCAETIEELPSAQPEIVRCKDCKWKQGAECVRFADVRPFPDDFCSRAERRTDG